MFARGISERAAHEVSGLSDGSSAYSVRGSPETPSPNTRISENSCPLRPPDNEEACAAPARRRLPARRRRPDGAHRPLPEGRLADVDSDHQLLERFRGGDGEAATELYLRYARRVRNLAKARCSPAVSRRLDPDDVVQSVFRRFFEHAQRGGFHVPAGKDLWNLILVIALNRIRAAEASCALERRTPPAAGPDAAPAGPLSWEGAIDEVLELFPPDCRPIVELRVRGHEVEEIAERTGRSRRTVERVLGTARERLRAALSVEP